MAACELACTHALYHLTPHSLQPHVVAKGALHNSGIIDAHVVLSQQDCPTASRTGLLQHSGTQKKYWHIGEMLIGEFMLLLAMS